MPAMRMSLVIAAAFLPGSGVLAASFDCQRAGTRVEKLICADPLLGRLDSQLDTAYRIALRAGIAAEKQAVAAAQKEWLQSVRDRCDSVDCLVAAYSDRIRVLAVVKTDRAAAKYVVDRHELQAEVSSLENALHRSGVAGKLSRCDIAIRLIDPNPLGSGRDVGYGAICSLNEREVMLCDDTMAGKLTLKLEGFTGSSGRDLADFTQANCPPGG